MKFHHSSIILLSILSIACKTQKKSAGETNIVAPVKIANITLYNQPADTIRKYIVGHRWQLLYSYGGITGKDKIITDGIYYTFMPEGKVIVETSKQVQTEPYELKKMRDIFTGDSTYVITGTRQWKVEGIFNDTLNLSDNFVDGYSHTLVRAQ